MKFDASLSAGLADKPTVHGAVDPPICPECKELDLSFFDPTCSGCEDILSNPRTSISEIFAILRQWVPQTQQHVNLLVNEVLKRGAHVDDKDGLTDMTLLHYVAKSGANGVGDANLSCKVIQQLIDKHCSLTIKCRWTDMSALHYAVFFDVAPVVKLLLTESQAEDIDRPCKEFDNGTSLHIACLNSSLKSAQVLIDFGANPHYPDKNGKLPIQCIPDAESLGNEAIKVITSLKHLVNDAMLISTPNQLHHLNQATLQALGLDLFDQVIVSGKVGVLKYCGSTEFASGQWAGIELNEPVGKNDGSVKGIKYFKCKPKYGIFAPLTRVNKFDGSTAISLSTMLPMQTNQTIREPVERTSLQLGDRVLVADQKIGVIRYLGPTKFANGTWVGIELDEPAGKNNGLVGGVQYFTCDAKYGIFAPLRKVKKIVEEKLNTTFETEAQTYNSPTQASEENREKKEDKKRVNINRNTEQQQQQSFMQPKKSHSNDEGTFGSRVNFALKIGMAVFVNKDVGTVKFIGRTHFSDGIWLGIELKQPNGRNDGVVEGQRYFTCKPKYGIMVRPSRATCRGINCSQLIDMKMR